MFFLSFYLIFFISKLFMDIILFDNILNIIKKKKTVERKYVDACKI